MKMSERLYINLLVPHGLETRNERMELLQLLETTAPQFSPEFYNTCEPVNQPYDPGDRESVLDQWKRWLFWKRRKHGVSGSIWNGDGRKHTTIYINARNKGIDQKDAVRFLTTLSSHYHVDLAYIHLQAQWEDQEAMQEGIGQQTLGPLYRGLFTRDIQMYLPELTWGMVFGAPYVALFGRDRLLSLPVYRVEELSETMIYVQLTENIADLRTRYDEVRQARQRAKQWLNSNAFFDPSLERHHRYTTPVFTFDGAATLRNGLPNGASDALTPADEKGDLFVLSEHLVEFARTMIQQHGHFHPFGGLINHEGKFEYYSAESGVVSSDDETIADFLAGALKAIATLSEVRAVGLCSHVDVVTSASDETLLAIHLRLEHRHGLAINVFYPYRRGHDGQIVYDQSLTEQTDSRMFTD